MWKPVLTIHWDMPPLDLVSSRTHQDKIRTFFTNQFSLIPKVKVLVAQLCLALCNSMDCSPPGPSVHGILQVRILEWVAIPFSRELFPSPGDLPNTGIEPRSPALQVDSLPAKPQGKPIRKASLVAQTVKNLPAMPETWVWSLGWEDPLEKGMATHLSIFAWRIPWTEEPGRLCSWGFKESDMT